MSRLIENLLTLARADGGGASCAASRSTSAALAESVCRQAAALHPGRADQLRRPRRPGAVAGDEDLLTQLLWILLDNAVKFTADGGHIWVAVTQRGATVAAHRRRRRRRACRPAPSSASSTGSTGPTRPAAVGGAGLGLAIAAWIVREHGGTIVAANNDRGGATFSVSLPALV